MEKDGGAHGGWGDPQSLVSQLLHSPTVKTVRPHVEFELGYFDALNPKMTFIFSHHINFFISVFLIYKPAKRQK